MEVGTICVAHYADVEYEVQRRLDDSGFSVWRDGAAEPYVVSLRERSCTCPDHVYRQRICKHVQMVEACISAH